MTPDSNLERVQETTSAEVSLPQPQAVDPHTLKAVRRRWVVDNWVLAVMIVCAVVFASAMALYVFVPAARTVLGN